jgi:hypothetical protein
MSIGNLKDTGNQGNNMPWQWSVLRGLQGILTQLQSTLRVSIVDPIGQKIMDESVAVVIASDQTNLPVEILGPLDNKTEADSVSVVLTNDQFKRAITPNILIQSGVDGNIPSNVYSISFASNGTANARVSFDGGTIFRDIPPGTTINMDAGGLGWFYQASTFYWDTTTNVNSSLIITYNT